MKLVDLKISKKEKKKMTETIGIDDSKYPWGLRLNFDNEMVDKIPMLKNVQAGQDISGMIKGKVVEISVNDSENGGKRHRVEIQVQKIGFNDKSSYDDSFDEATKKGK